MHDYLRAIALGLIQGMSEFLPVSSSGHLVLAPLFLGDRSSSLTFDVGLHVGTLAATLLYFWRDFVAIGLSALRDLVRHGPRIGRWGWHARLGLWIALGTLPAVIAGVLFDGAIEAYLRAPWVVGVQLIAFGLVLAWADRLPVQREALPDLGARDAMKVGVAQAVALMPGVSRSGITIAAARALGFDRVTATRFSFLLSAPAVLGAATLTMSDALRGSEVLHWGPLVTGAATSALVGAAVIHWLLRYVARHSLQPFVWYRVALGALVLVLVAARVL